MAGKNDQSEVELEEKIIRDFDEAYREKRKKQPKTFKRWQAILILGMTLFLCIGGGAAFGITQFGAEIDVKRVKEQLEFFEQRIQLDPNNLEYRVNKAYSHYLLGDNSEAIKELKWVIDRDPNYYDAHLNLGLVYLHAGHLDEAMFSFHQAIKISPRDYKGHMNLGRVFTEMGRYEEAMNALYEADILSPLTSDIIFYIGYVGERSGDLDFAEEVYRETLRYDPTFKNALDGLNRVQQQKELAEREGTS